MNEFRAYRINLVDKEIVADFQTLTLDDLSEGQVVVKVRWSSVNYKDALAASGKGRILRRYPLNGGVDLAGEVMASEDSRFKEGDEVLVCGCGLSETRDGGYAEVARVCGDCIVPLPAGLSMRDAMALGTAGFSAALAVMRLEQMGQNPSHGPMLVTGATGGVGSFAVDMFAARGYSVTAFTGKSDHHDYLRRLGASDFVDRNTLEMGEKPLETALWGGAVDNVGGKTLAWLTRTVKPFGNIASIGLAGGYELNTTVMPFILRSVSLIGVNTIELPSELRLRAWERLGDDLKPKHLDEIVTREVNFEDLPSAFEAFLTSAVLGRTVVKIA